MSSENEAQENWSRTLQPLYPETPTVCTPKESKRNTTPGIVQYPLAWRTSPDHLHMFHALNCVDKAHWIALNFTCCRKWHSNCNRRRKTAKMWPWPDQGCPGMIGIRFEKAFPFWRAGVFSAMGKASFCEVNYLQMVPNGDEWQGKRMLYITFDLSSHRVSWFFLHMASWIKMSGNFYVSVASLVAFITLFCSISQRYM